VCVIYIPLRVLPDLFVKTAVEEEIHRPRLYLMAARKILTGDRLTALAELDSTRAGALAL
jgi:hypothetical protein